VVKKSQIGGEKGIPGQEYGATVPTGENGRVQSFKEGEVGVE
jgi:hypothetical protein